MGTIRRRIEGICLAVATVTGLAAGTLFAGEETASHTTYGLGAGAVDAGTNNTFIGLDAGAANTSANANTFLGWHAGLSNTTGFGNTFLGVSAGSTGTAPLMSTYVGAGAGMSGTGGQGSTALGFYAGYFNAGNHNTLLGFYAGVFNSTGHSNTFVGTMAGYSNATGYRNMNLGYYTGYSNIDGYYNTYVGNYAGHHNKHGMGNTIIGDVAGMTNTGSRNVFIGYGAGYSETGSQRLYIENTSSTAPLIYGEFDNNIVAINGSLGIGTQSPSYPLQMVSGAHVTVGGVWTNASSREYKQSIAPLGLDAALGTLKALEPVTYEYKVSPEEQYVGFIAEDVPELVAMKDRRGLSPMDIVAVLTKVVQQQQTAIEEQRETISRLSQQMAEVIRRAEEGILLQSATH